MMLSTRHPMIVAFAIAMMTLLGSAAGAFPIARGAAHMAKSIKLADRTQKPSIPERKLRLKSGGQPDHPMK